MEFEKKTYIFNIQKYSTHDGPGIRTTVFFKGCPLRCLWCHNPESQSYEPEYMVEENGLKKQVGRYYSVNELFKELIKDQIFYDESDGGVTFSGGEVMAQDMEYVLEISRLLKRRGIYLAVDTCGYAPKRNFEKMLSYVDLWLYDIKAFSMDKHKLYTGKGNDLILENLKFLSDNNAKIIIRMIIIEGVNSSIEYIQKVINWLVDNNIKVEEINLLPYHDFGRNKYKQLERSCTQNFMVPDKQEVETIKNYIISKGFKVQIGG